MILGYVLFSKVMSIKWSSNYCLHDTNKYMKSDSAQLTLKSSVPAIFFAFLGGGLDVLLLSARLFTSCTRSSVFKPRIDLFLLACTAKTLKTWRIALTTYL